MTVVVLVVLGGAFAAILFSYARRNLSPPADKYLAHVARGDYRSAYEMLGPEWKKTQSFDQFVEFEKSIRSKLGPLKRKTMAGTNISSSGDGTIARLDYNAEFEKAEGVLKFTLSKGENGWTVEGLKYNSAALDELLVCPSCGATQPELARFCSTCGKPMSGQELTSSSTGSERMTSEPLTAASHSSSVTTSPAGAPPK